MPYPPCPANQKNPDASGANPATGDRSETKLRKPAQRLCIRRMSSVVADSIRSTAIARSMSSGIASHGVLGVSTPGEISRSSEEHTPELQVTNAQLVCRLVHERN